jgi:hypothetical protein
LDKKGRTCHVWWSERPPGLCDKRFTFAYIFAAVEPGSDNGFALVMPYADTEAMHEFLDRFSDTIADDEHVAMSPSIRPGMPMTRKETAQYSGQGSGADAVDVASIHTQLRTVRCMVVIATLFGSRAFCRYRQHAFSVDPAWSSQRLSARSL